MAGVISSHDSMPRAMLNSSTAVRKADGTTKGKLPPLKALQDMRAVDAFRGPHLPSQKMQPPLMIANEATSPHGHHHQGFLESLDTGLHSGLRIGQKETEEALEALEEANEEASHVVKDAAGAVVSAMANLAEGMVEGTIHKSSIKYRPGEEPHKDYPETCLFIRKLKTGMHFELFGQGGKKQHCTLLLSANNSALHWHAGSKTVSYRFADLVKVDMLEKRESFERAARARQKELRESEPCWFTLVFRVAASPKTISSKAKTSSVAPSDLEMIDVFIELSGNNVHDRSYAVRGLELMRLYHSHHEDTHSVLKDKLCAPLIRALEFTHHLYRPHHNLNHPPASWHNGTIVEVVFDASYDVVVSQRSNWGKHDIVTKSRLNTPCPVFQGGMFLRAYVVSFDGAEDGGHYKLEYKDGPYFCDEEPSGDVPLLNALPNGVSAADIALSKVKPACISVDMDANFKSEPPFFLLAVSLLQIAMFVYYVFAENDGVADATTPVAGPEVLWMKAVDAFPLCNDLRGEVWRLASYQWVHAGIQHIGLNMVMQLVFGLPLNMVHGSVRFGLIYQLGVIGGALCFCIDGAHGALVGCSGGVYCIFGMHLAEIIMNGDADNKGLLNKWTRLFIIVALLAIDGVVYLYSKSQSTSYAAHIGGIVVGLLAGVVVLDNLEETWAERNMIIPGSGVVLCALLLVTAVWYALHSPPQSLFINYEPTHEPCCWELLRCGTLEVSDFSSFSCRASYDEPAAAWTYQIKYEEKVQANCAEYTSAALVARNSSA